MLSTLSSAIGLFAPLAALAGALGIMLAARAWSLPLQLAARAGAIILAGWALFQFGSLHARGACATAGLKVELAAARIDLEAAHRITRQTRQRMAEADSLAALNQDKIDALAADIARRPAGACLLDDADARRLREFGRTAKP